MCAQIDVVMREVLTKPVQQMGHTFKQSYISSKIFRA